MYFNQKCRGTELEGGTLWLPLCFPPSQQGPSSHTQSVLYSQPLPSLHSQSRQQLTVESSPVWLEGRMAEEKHCRVLGIWSEELWDSSLPKSKAEIVKRWEKPLHEWLRVCWEREKVFCVRHRETDTTSSWIKELSSRMCWAMRNGVACECINPQCR